MNDLRRCEEALRLAVEQGSGDIGIASKVRSMVGDQLAGLVMATADLQKKAREKLGDGLWWCTERSLSQSTPAPVADLKARWHCSDLVLDLCCGLGGDLIAIARVSDPAKRTMTAIDRDPTMVAMAAENLRLNGGDTAPPVDVVCDEVSDNFIPPAASIHIDPDRRDGADRTTRPQDFSPPWDLVEQLIGRVESSLVKLAPASAVDDLPDRHRLWISLAGSVREQTLLAGRSIESAAADLGVSLQPGCRSAVIVCSSGDPIVFSGIPNLAAVESVEAVGPWIVDPDASIRAAGLTETFAAEKGLQLIGKASGFLTGAAELPAGLAISEAVIWSGACDDRKLRKTLRRMNCYPSRVKTRGVAQNPNVLEKRYRECGEKPITLWIGRASRRQYAVFSEPRQGG